MKLFPQLALVSAIAISGNAMAMQALDDTAMSAATGQEGITVTITPPTGGIVIDQLVVNDADGRTGNGLSGDAGSITLGNLTGGTDLGATDFAIDTTGIELVIDADGNGGAPVLNVGVNLGATTITTGDIGVAVGGTTVGSQATTVKVLNSMDISFDSLALNVQLGNEAQGSMIQVDATVTGGLTISDFALIDAGGAVGFTGGEIAIGSIVITDAGDTDLTIDTAIDVNTDGLVITTGGTAMDVVLNDVRLGDINQATLGDVGLYGLNMSGTTITVAGNP